MTVSVEVRFVRLPPSFTPTHSLTHSPPVLCGGREAEVCQWLYSTFPLYLAAWQFSIFAIAILPILPILPILVFREMVKEIHTVTLFSVSCYRVSGSGVHNSSTV